MRWDSEENARAGGNWCGKGCVWRDFPDSPVWDEGEWNYGVMESWYDGMMKSRNQRKEIWVERMVGEGMQAEIKWLDDPEVFRVNQVPAHSDHVFYADGEEVQAGRSSFAQSLNGDWQFCYAVNAKERPAEFYRTDFDASGFDWIQVPGHIELAGYDKIQYINTMYPWEGHLYRRPAGSLDGRADGAGQFSEAAYNPVGSYLKRFDLEEGLKGKRVSICFEGVEQAVYVWLNGAFVGYAEDSFTPSEFDLTPYIQEKDNVLAVEVHKRSTAAYLEDQDFFRFFGIYRNVTLYAKPLVHVEDLWARPMLHEDFKSGSLEVDLRLSGEMGRIDGRVRMTLQDAQGMVCFEECAEAAEQVRFSGIVMETVTPWEHENPYLYRLQIELLDEEGRLREVVPYPIGFRKIEIRDKVMLLNGRRLIINGVNRHEWSAQSGRCIGTEEMETDLRIFRENHINAVRTCHYPDQLKWYGLCDQNGIYVMAEVNLESHGSWQKMGAVEPSWNVPGSLPQWREAVLDRARTNFETFKNHVSVLFWSLGNESYAGDNIEEMNRYYKEKDSSRLVHYEGVFHNRAYDKTISDVESRMYAPPEQIVEYLEKEPQKPFLLCEYMHDMGNSLGGMKSYMDLLDRYPMYQGGFIWDYIDQALWVEDEVTGQRVLRYGGDFDDRPSDYEFSGNGIVFADRTEKPAMQEVKYYYGLYR